VSIAVIFAMFSFSLATSISPGPVNMMVISSSISYGIKKTMPFILGATIGFTLLLALIGLGLINIFGKHTVLVDYFEIAGASFIIYLGYKIATSTPTLSTKNYDKKTLKFYEGFLLQWLNPKAWVVCVSGVSMFVSDNSTFVLFVFMFFVVCYFSLFSWGFLGQKAIILLNSSKKIKIFNYFMGGILIVSALVLILTNFAFILGHL